LPSSLILGSRFAATIHSARLDKEVSEKLTFKAAERPSFALATG